MQFLWWLEENEGDPKKLRHLVFSLSKCESSAPSTTLKQQPLSLSSTRVCNFCGVGVLIWFWCTVAAGSHVELVSKLSYVVAVSHKLGKRHKFCVFRGLVSLFPQIWILTQRLAIRAFRGESAGGHQMIDEEFKW